MKPEGWHILQDYRYREHPYLHPLRHLHLILVFMFEALLTIIVTITKVELNFGCFFQHHSYSPRRLLRQIRFLHYHLHPLRDRKVDFLISHL